MFGNQTRLEYFVAIVVIARAEGYKYVSPKNEINDNFKCDENLRSAQSSYNFYVVDTLVSKEVASIRMRRTLNPNPNPNPITQTCT